MAKFYVTTSIPYTNDKPHLGHAMEFIEADVLARYHRQLKDSVFFSTGTDEHGGKVLEKARAVGKEPKAFVDETSQKFKDLCGALAISNDAFIRTTDQAHEQVAQYLWQQISKYIYKGKYKGYYDTGEEEFVTEIEAKANKGVSPHNGRAYEVLEEENYFFALKSFGELINKAITSGDFRVEPATRRNEILAVLKSGLEDISISRPADKISWGVPVPNDPTQVMYVWFEALINYISVLGYPNDPKFKTFWPADVQVIGKNIIRFHAAIWPAMLIAAGLPLPKALYVHGFITVDGKKMGKSLGNAVDPYEVLQKYGTDAFRYYFLHAIPSEDDGDFSWKRLEGVYNSDLANELGNLVQRTGAMVKQYQNGVVGKLAEPSHDLKLYHDALANFRFDKALDEVWLLVKGLNQYIDEEKPWQLAKEKEGEEHLGEVLAYLVTNILQVGSLLVPFLPDTAAKIEATFAGGLVHPEVGILFPRIEEPKPAGEPA